MASPKYWLLKLLGRTTTPTLDAGLLWYRGDEGLLYYSDGSDSCPVLVGNVPLLSSTRWHAIEAQGTGAATALQANRAYAMPFRPGRVGVLTGVAVNISAAFTTAGNVRAGLYRDDGTGLPGARVADYGTVAATAGVRSWTGLTTNLSPTMYWLVFAWQGGSSGSPTFTGKNIWSSYIGTAAAASPGNSNTAYYTDTGFSGAFPSSFGAVAGTVVGPAPVVQVT